MSAPRIAVFGCGYMGSLHATKVAALAAEGRVRFAGVADVDPAARRGRREAPRRARRDGLPARSSGRRTRRSSRCPTVRHFAVVRAALGAGLDVLVEKPIAANLAEAEKLLAEAGARGAASSRSATSSGSTRPCRRSARASASPRFVEAHRMGPFPGRATDVDVVRDLMIHDLDVVQRLVGEEPETVDAIGVPVLSARGRHRERAPPLPGRLRRELHREPGLAHADAQGALLPAATATSRSTSSSSRS